MKIIVTREHIDAAIREKRFSAIGFSSCCPLHQALRPFLKPDFDVGTKSVSSDRGIIATFTPTLPAELCIPQDWPLAKPPYEFDVTFCVR